MHVFKVGETRQCSRCGYKIAAPYPANCPRCNEPLDKTVSSVAFPVEETRSINARKTTTNEELYSRDFAKTIAKKTKMMSGLSTNAVPRSPPTPLGQDGDYVKMMGVIDTQSRETIFCSNDDYQYILELGANALEIASSILGGTLERILLEPPVDQSNMLKKNVQTPQASITYEEAIFQTNGNLLFCIYGVFFKRPAILLQELKRLLIDIFKGQINGLISTIARSEIERRTNSVTAYIIHEYQKIRDEALHQATIPTLENQVKLHYIGLSYQTIGTMALLITPQGDDALPIRDIAFSGDTQDGSYQDLLESLISAKIEAIAANTLAQTGAFPRYIITKTSFDKYRLIEFLQLGNDYFLQLLASGNADILESVINTTILPEIISVTAVPFSGMLTTQNEIKVKLREIFLNNYFYELE